MNHFDFENKLKFLSIHWSDLCWMDDIIQSSIGAMLCFSTKAEYNFRSNEFCHQSKSHIGNNFINQSSFRDKFIFLRVYFRGQYVWHAFLMSVSAMVHWINEYFRFERTNHQICQFLTTTQRNKNKPDAACLLSLTLSHKYFSSFNI